ncbi:hypothetical protein [Candidatus Spongiihabitans sp.]
MTPVFVAQLKRNSHSFKGVRLRRTTYFNWIPACGENDGLGGQW